MSRILYLDCIGGVAGDMFLAALIDAGASFSALESVVETLGLDSKLLTTTRVQRQSVGALHMCVEIERPAVPHRAYVEIRELLEGAPLPARVRERSLEAFAKLAEVESKIHDAPLDEVHLHEVGSLDTLVDICGAMTLLDDLEIDRVVCSPLPYSRTMIRASGAVLPGPAPATLALLRGAPLIGVRTAAELVTPTGAAILATVVAEWGSLPPLTLEAVGYGAGTADLDDRPNLLRAVVGTSADWATETVVQIETNLDDFSPELVPHAVARCFEARALDVWTVPAQMKKGRPGFVLSALARPDDAPAVARVILEETSALGVRLARLDRYELEREQVTITVDNAPVRVKLGRLDDRIVNVAPEHDDCAAVAAATGKPIKSIWAAAIAAAREQ